MAKPALLTVGLAAGIVGFAAPAAATPEEISGTAQQTIDELRAQGYRSS